jgi:hypothetical protein
MDYVHLALGRLARRNTTKLRHLVVRIVARNLGVIADTTSGKRVIPSWYDTLPRLASAATHILSGRNNWVLRPMLFHLPSPRHLQKVVCCDADRVLVPLRLPVHGGRDILHNNGRG